MPYKVKFDTGQEVDFANPPTQQDIEEVAKKISVKPVEQAPEQHKDLLQKTTDAITSIFPGGQLGTALGNSIYGAGQGAKGAYQSIKGDKVGAKQSFENASQAVDENGHMVGKVAGDVGGIVLSTLPISTAGNAASKSLPILGRLGANAAIGAGLGGTNAIAEGKNTKEVLGDAALGGGIGLGGSVVAEGLGALAKNLPSWLAKAYLPKLKSGTAPDALKRMSIGLAPSTILEKSGKAVQNYENQIQSILSHPNYEGVTGYIAGAVDSVIQSHPNAQLDTNKTINIIKQVAPNSKALVDKVASGVATLEEQNLLRRELDQATKKAYTDKPQLTYAKQVAKSMADFLRGNVQSTAKESIPVFSEYSKELNVYNALKDAVSKNKPRVTLADIGAGASGLAHGGITGAAKGILAERILRNPAFGISVAKGIQNVAKSGPTLNAVGKFAKIPIIHSLTQKK